MPGETRTARAAFPRRVRTVQDRARRFAHDGAMTIDLPAAGAFIATHARVLDRRRFALRFERADAAGALAALDAYRNPDGGYGWGLEPDLRAAESQPGAALHAFEVFADAAPATSPRALELCDWLASVSLPDGGLPFALPYAQAAGTARWWAGADPRTSSLHITAAVTAAARRAARHDPALARHSWLADATRFCLEAIAAREQPRSTMELLFSLRLLDAVVDDEPTAGPLLDRWAAAIPPSGLLQVQGGAEDEAIRPLDFSPEPDRPLRRHLAPDLVAADLDRLAGGQRDDGGWDIDHVAYSPASELEWRGYMTVHALGILAANGRALR
jgi:hypothetical protein